MAFTMVVRHVFDVPGRDLVAVSGILESGSVPSPGTVVTISRNGGHPWTAHLAGTGPIASAGPLTSVALRGVTAADIQIGAHISTAEALDDVASSGVVPTAATP
jgi:hypothetical protein